MVEDKLHLGIKNEQVPFFSSRFALSLRTDKKGYYAVVFKRNSGDIVRCA